MAVRRQAEDPASRIERLVASQERRFREVFIQAIVTLRDQRTLDELADLLAAGRLEEALDGLINAAEAIGDTYGEALARAGRDAATFLNTALTVTVAFDVVNFRAVQAIQANRLRLIQGIDSSLRATIRQALADGIARGLNPRDQARLFRDVLGLTPNQYATIENFRRLLSAGADGQPLSDALNRSLRDARFDGTIERAIREGTPLTQSQIDRMVRRYQARLITFRANTIARTEALRSVNQGTELMYRQAFDSGALQPEQVVRTWVTAGDSRVRDPHSAINGIQRTGLDEPWVSGDGNELRYPGDPSAPGSETINCRCAITTRVQP